MTGFFRFDRWIASTLWMDEIENIPKQLVRDHLRIEDSFFFHLETFPQSLRKSVKDIGVEWWSGVRTL